MKDLMKIHWNNKYYFNNIYSNVIKIFNNLRINLTCK